MKDNILEELVRLNYQASHDHILKPKDISEEETFHA